MIKAADPTRRANTVVQNPTTDLFNALPARTLWYDLTLRRCNTLNRYALDDGSNWPIIEEMTASGRYAFDVGEASTARLSARG